MQCTPGPHLSVLSADSCLFTFAGPYRLSKVSQGAAKSLLTRFRMCDSCKSMPADRLIKSVMIAQTSSCVCTVSEALSSPSCDTWPRKTACTWQVEAEKAAWELSKEHGFTLLTVNPTFVIGPVISDRIDATSIQTVQVHAFSSHLALPFLALPFLACPLLAFPLLAGPLLTP